MSRREAVLLGVIVLGATVLRFATLDLQSFWHDEAVTAQRTLQPGLGTTLSGLGDSERTPPLYYVLAWGWTELFGRGEVGLRSLSALFGTLTVPAVFAAGRELASVRAGLAAAALVATNPFLVYFSQEARALALLALLAALGVCFFVRLLRRPSAAAAAGWAAVSALALLTHYFAVFGVAPQALWLLWARRRPETWLAVGATGAVALALAPLALHQSTGGGASSDPEAASVAHQALAVPVSFLLGELLGARQVAAAAPFLIAGLLVAGWLLWRRGDQREQRAALLAGALGAVAVAIPLVLAIAGPDTFRDPGFFKPRSVIAAIVPLTLAVAIGLGVRRAGRVGPAATGVLCAASLAVTVAADFVPGLQREDWRGVARVLRTTGPTAIVTFRGADDPLDVYLPGGLEELEPGTRVRTIVVARRESDAAPPATPPGSRPAGWQRTGAIDLFRFTTDGRGEVDPAVLAGLDGVPRRPVLYRTPRDE